MLLSSAQKTKCIISSSEIVQTCEIIDLGEEHFIKMSYEITCFTR